MHKRDREVLSVGLNEMQPTFAIAPESLAERYQQLVRYTVTDPIDRLLIFTRQRWHKFHSVGFEHSNRHTAYNLLRHILCFVCSDRHILIEILNRLRLLIEVYAIHLRPEHLLQQSMHSANWIHLRVFVVEGEVFGREMVQISTSKLSSYFELML
jgi:hypothetical protein